MEERTYDQGDMARRGDALYEERVRPNVDEKVDHGKFVAIDVETGDWQLGADELEAIDRLEERRPEARGRVWLTRVGLGYGAKIGGRPYKSEAR